VNVPVHYSFPSSDYFSILLACCFKKYLRYCTKEISVCQYFLEELEQFYEISIISFIVFNENKKDGRNRLLNAYVLETVI
jgi:hypothetical protein